MPIASGALAPEFCSLAMDWLNSLLGIGKEAKNFGFLQVGLRGVIVFLVALVIIRLADKRFLAKMSAFDALLGFALASMLARAINGSAPFFPTLVTGFVLVGLHRVMGWLAFRLPWFEGLVKGEAETLVKEGRRDHQKLRANKISEKDLMEEIRLNGELDDVSQVHLATMERSGEISVVPKEE